MQQFEDIAPTSELGPGRLKRSTANVETTPRPRVLIADEDLSFALSFQNTLAAAGIDYPHLVYSYLDKEVRTASLIPLVDLCRLAGVSRAGYCRWRDSPPPVDVDMDLRDEIQRIALESPCYGWRRVTAELRRRGWTANHKRVRRIMREDNLLCLRRKKFVATTDSNHARPVYPNRAGSMVLTGIDQLWVADITYIRLETEFVYLAVVLDAYSRRVIGWAPDRTLEGDLAIAALRMALRHLRVIHENAQVRGGLSAGVPGSGRGSRLNRGLYRACLQRKASALIVGLPPAGGV